MGDSMLEIAAKALYDSEHERSIHADQIIARVGNREFKDTMEPYTETAESCWRGDAVAIFKALAAAPLDDRVVEAAARALATQRIPAYADDAIWAEDLSALKRREERAERFSDFGMARAALTAAFTAISDLKTGEEK